ncbi:sensor histidine kinase [Cellulomonas chengniuliangii]|uniref:Oxygen sensor histidine kinase NreB n=1 Tax=Cellulomonas chengniuliangii TaxID=2968084 RepID=A0ABY5KZ23_9CELL|nr:sensor histidine kinase [Cellulomonas chengniuliangii]MCC2309343.1 sensor domain-containing protein [Cellulomonas chengniuliangii]UUI75088.1 sensor domain-containing protein [Cellulomonas chengniuliangii]
MDTHTADADLVVTRPPAQRRAGIAGRTIDAIEQLVGGFGTSVLALVALLWVAVSAAACVVGVGFWMLPAALRAVRVVADRERSRLSQIGPVVLGPAPLPDGLRDAFRDSSVRRELAWLPCAASLGLALGAIALTLPLNAARDATFALWWMAVPEELRQPSFSGWVVETWPGAIAVTLAGFAWVAVAVGLEPPMARLQAWPGRRLLGPRPGTDLALRVAELTATRAGALDAHAAELRRIERSLHDGTQNRIVAVSVLLGAAQRALLRDPAAAGPLLERAQDAAEQALAELRAVARSILPAVLEDRTLGDALSGLAATSPVPCRLDIADIGRCAASVEATAYFVVAEALTNVVRHSGAQSSVVTVRRDNDRLEVTVQDDGMGGAAERAAGERDRTGGGSGLAGIRRRVQAHDGIFTLTSPVGGPTTLEVTLPCGL